MILSKKFFDRDSQIVAQELLGKILRHYCYGIWLSAQIIETEAYYLTDKASHASLGFTEKRKALFMPAGTIYMYYARGSDSFNISCSGDGNAVLIKSGIPYTDDKNNKDADAMLTLMQKLNPQKNGMPRNLEQLCAGQTLLCKSLNLKVKEWDQKAFNKNSLYIDDVGIKPQQIIQTTRLGIPLGRDEHLPYRFISQDYVMFCSKKPLKQKRK